MRTDQRSIIIDRSLFVASYTGTRRGYRPGGFTIVPFSQRARNKDIRKRMSARPRRVHVLRAAVRGAIEMLMGRARSVTRLRKKNRRRR